jgi:hypothetical protein
MLRQCGYRMKFENNIYVITVCQKLSVALFSNFCIHITIKKILHPYVSLSQTSFVSIQFLTGDMAPSLNARI